MRRIGRLSARTAIAFAIAFACVPLSATAGSPVVPLGDELTSEPLVGTPMERTMGTSASERHFYTIDLAPGEAIHLNLHAEVSEGDLDLHLYRPGTTLPISPSDVVGVSATEAYPESISYLVPPLGGGTYYVSVSVFQPLYAPMSYTLEGDVTTPGVHRLSGDDRYATSTAISRSTYATSTAAVLATGASFPDALAASALAGVLDAPLLLVRNSTIAPAFNDMLRELDRLGVTRAYIVGGETVISQATESAIRERVPDTHRLRGDDRYETARAVADKVALLIAEGGGTVDAAFLVRGDEFADALAAGPYAFSQRMPVLLTRSTKLDPLAAAFIEAHDITDVTLVGGTNAVSAGVESTVSALNGGATIVERRGGEDRNETAADLALHAVDEGWATWGHVGIATGLSFPDALSGSAAMGRRGGVMLLTNPTSFSSPGRDAMSANMANVDLALVFGGPVVIYDAVMAQIEALLP